MKVILKQAELASHKDLIKLAYTLNEVINEIIAGDDKTNENLLSHQKYLKKHIIKDSSGR